MGKNHSKPVIDLNLPPPGSVAWWQAQQLAAQRQAQQQAQQQAEGRAFAAAMDANAQRVNQIWAANIRALAQQQSAAKQAAGYAVSAKSVPGLPQVPAIVKTLQANNLC